MRLQKFFSDCGVLSRRAAEAEIAAGNVTVNGKIAQLGDSVIPENDIVIYRGKRLLPRADKPHTYIMLNKPRGIVTTAKDEKSRRTVTDLTHGVGTRVYPVGRLDMDSDGLLLLTDDGAFTNRLTHPRHEIPKIYHVTVSAPPTEAQLSELSSPMTIDAYPLQPVQIIRIAERVLEMHLMEGRNRQIRRMCDAVGLKVLSLRRIAIGEVTLGTLPVGQWRFLTQDEVAYLSGQQTTIQSESGDS